MKTGNRGVLLGFAQIRFFSLQMPQNLLRNIFLKTRKINSLRKIFLSLLQENLTSIKNISQNKNNFLDIKKTFLTKKNISFFKIIVLILRPFS